jgi:hypothetical protein
LIVGFPPLYAPDELAATDAQAGLGLRGIHAMDGLENDYASFKETLIAIEF